MLNKRVNQLLAFVEGVPAREKLNLFYDMIDHRSLFNIHTT